MKLQTYLDLNKLKPSEFAKSIGVAPSTITRVLNGQRGVGLKVLTRITAGTKGQVRAEDFLDPQEEAA